MASKHIIEQIRWEVEITDSEEYLPGQDQLSNYLKSKLLPRLEQVLDRLDPGESVLFIQKLEINLDLIYKSGWDLDFEWAFTREFEKRLHDLGLEGVKGQNSQIQIITTHDYKYQKLVLFLEFGISDQDPIELIRDTLETDEVANYELLSLLLKEEEVRERIIRQAGPEFLRKMMNKWSREEASLNISTINQKSGGRREAINFPDEWEPTLNYFIENEAIFYSEMIDKLSKFYFEKGGGKQKAINRGQSVFQELLTLKEVKRARLETKKVLIEKLVDEILEGEYALQENLGNQTSSYSHQTLPEHIYVSNAGIVLIWPFLVHYFKVLGLLNGNQQFISLQHQKRAVQLLHYLGTGQDETPEEYMILNKLICALPFEIGVDRKLNLSQDEIEWTNNLFDVVKQRWKKIQSSSDENIRGSFFLRKGRLKSKHNLRDWDLIVEKRAYDILMESLSWSINLVRLPWMENILYVSWH